MKRIVSSALVLILVFLLTACGGRPVQADVSAPIPEPNAGAQEPAQADPELARAISYGLMPPSLQKSGEETVSYAELCAMLGTVIEHYDPGLVAKWESSAAKAISSNRIPTRAQGALAIFEAAVVLGIDDTRAETVITYNVESLGHGDYWEGAMGDIPEFPNAGRKYVHRDGTVDEYEFRSNACWFAEEHVSMVSYKAIYEPTPDWSMRWGDNLTRSEAVHAALRLLECDARLLAPKPEYISIGEAGTYDKTIIPDAFLFKETALPEATQEKLPLDWKGSGISARKDAEHPYRSFSESDIRFLAENGMNFARVFFDFTTLGWPDFPAGEARINKNELEALDQLISWGIQYGVHIQISCCGVAGHPCQGEQFENLTAAEWKLYQDEWGMLAARYAGIDNRYLTFDLLNEWSPERDYPQNAARIGAAAMAVKAADPIRVVLYSYNGTPDPVWVEQVAAQGIAVGCHPYRPGQISNWKDDGLGDPQWPWPWFPSELREGQSITVSGMGGSALLVNFFAANQKTVINVYFDGVLSTTLKPGAGNWDENGDSWEIDGNPYEADVPVGVEEVRLELPQNSIWAALNSIGCRRGGKTTYLMPHDVYDGSAGGGACLAVDAQGRWNSADGRYYTAEEVFQDAVAPLQEIAQKHSVGFMVNEFGIFGFDQYWDMELVGAYCDDMLAMFDRHNISWCLCETQGWPYRMLTAPIPDFSWQGKPVWTGMTVTPRTYSYHDGRSDMFWVNQTLLDVFRKHTLNQNSPIEAWASQTGQEETS